MFLWKKDVETLGVLLFFEIYSFWWNQWVCFEARHQNHKKKHFKIWKFLLQVSKVLINESSKYIHTSIIAPPNESPWMKVEVLVGGHGQQPAREGFWKILDSSDISSYLTQSTEVGYHDFTTWWSPQHAHISKHICNIFKPKRFGTSFLHRSNMTWMTCLPNPRQKWKLEGETWSKMISVYRKTLLQRQYRKMHCLKNKQNGSLSTTSH